MIETIFLSGIYGLLTIVSTILLLVIHTVVLSQYRTKKTLLILAACSLLPLLFGSIGTYNGYTRVNQYEQTTIENTQKTRKKIQNVQF